MTARAAPVRSSRNGVAVAKASARRAYAHARAAGGLATAVADRVWCDTLLAVEGQPVATRREMFMRTGTLLALLADRQTWAR